ncbi:MAG: efflux RND transporter periplasmic adaptor subunit [Planctomycetes bacterium]|nr:efflux RND transporter periplasmic adaptor subunit [Planctomycetota bacterium]
MFRRVKSLVICWMACSVLFASGPARGQEGPPPALVRLAKAERKKVRETVALIGTVEPIKESTVASDVAGRIEKIHHRRGDHIKKGDLIAELRATPLLLMVDEARSRVQSADAQRTLAQLTYERSLKLQRSNAVSAQDLDENQGKLDVARADLAAAKARLQQLEQDLADSKICAPFDGAIVEEFTELGEWVIKGGPVVKLTQIDPVKVVVDVPERYYRQTKVGVELTVTIDALPGREYKGRINALIPKANGGARTFPAEIHIGNKKHEIGLGMLARVQLPVGEPKDMICIAQDALIPTGRRYMAYKVVDGKAVPVDLDLVSTFAGMAAVNGPLAPGDEVVVEGNERLRPGQPVRTQ